MILIFNILEVRTPSDRVFQRVRNTMAGLLNAELNTRIRNALGRLSDEEIRVLDESTSRLGLAEDRIVNL